ncbi:MAG: hypothetical protein K2I95_00025, partial [Treponemataceae bacterium]|nr:hypothetical protein [Treponemataceae bacterium]
GFDFQFESECTANGARFSIDCTGAELKNVFERLGECAFAPLFSDEVLQRHFKKIKGQEISSAENFINAQINSRVFKNFSRQGVGAPFPPFSGQKNLSELRAIVNRIFQEYYAPQNCAIFVSGAIKAKNVLHLAQETFGKHALRPQTAEKSFFLAKEIPESEASVDSNADFSQQEKKFVLCDKDFSPDFVQVAAQFSPLEKNKAKIAAEIFEAKNSALKNSLVQNAALAIRGSDYVNAAAATKRNLSRVVFQTLFEKSEIPASEQIKIFEKIIGEEICGFSEADVDAAKKNLCEDFYDSISNPKLFMENFSRFWTDEISENKIQGGTLLEQFLSIPEKIAAENFADLKSALQKNEPWIFILLNDKILSPLKNEFENSGYEIVLQKERGAKEQDAEAVNLSAHENSLQAEIPIYNANFVSQSRSSEKSFFLSNKIRVTLKENPSSKKSAVALYIFGGEAFDAETNYGMQSVLADILERNISDFLAQKISLGEISRSAKATTSISDTEFLVILECNSNEEKVALQCIGEGLLFNDFAPSRVDLALNARRAKQILRAGSPAWQMYSAGARQFYKSAIYRSLYSLKKEILENIKYNDALEAYQKLLDAGRIEIIAAGNFGEISKKEFVEECESILGSLKESKFKRKFSSEPNKVSKTSLAVKLEHTFLTDISADKAGPRPAVLVPTTEFHDPVQFWIRAPKIFEDDATIFDALILELEAQCKKIAAQNFAGIEVRLENRSALVSFGAITFFNVKKISDADFILKRALEQLRENLFSNSNESSNNADSDFQKEEFFNQMKAHWIKARYSESHKNAETIAHLAREASIARLSDGEPSKADISFVREYETVALCENERFREIWKKYFEEPPFKLYSLDSKK